MNWTALQSASIDDVLAWAEGEPWCRAMAECRQDEGWHAEGDVWTHTRMVCGELPRLDEWATLSGRERSLLTFTALFHDAAKPLVSVVDSKTGRVTSPKHAVKGEQLARSVLRELGCDVAVREEIARQVRFHGRPVFLLEKPVPEHEVVALSWLVDVRLLYLFALADSRGRTTDAAGRPEETLHLWRLAAEELGCLGRPYAFANDHARFRFLRGDETTRNLHHVPHEGFTCTVTMVSGLPGSGKDTWLSGHRSELPVVSLDDVRAALDVEPTDDQGAVAQEAGKRCREHLRAGRSFAFNATNLTRRTRRRWIDLMADYGARIHIVWIEPPFATILERNRRRSAPVPEGVVRRMAERLEPPTWQEAHDVVYVAGDVAGPAPPRGGRGR